MFVFVFVFCSFSRSRKQSSLETIWLDFAASAFKPSRFLCKHVKHAANGSHVDARLVSQLVGRTPLSPSPENLQPFRITFRLLELLQIIPAGCTLASYLICSSGNDIFCWFSVPVVCKFLFCLLLLRGHHEISSCWIPGFRDFGNHTTIVPHAAGLPSG